MYFPSDMNFQYFFFDTYPGYFLQALPIALLAGAVYGLLRFRRDTQTPLRRKLFSCAFVCYLTGLLCLTLALELMGSCWYRLLYHADSMRTVRWFGGTFDLTPDFFLRLGGETVGNFLMLLSFGILYPLSRKAPTWKGTVLAGTLTVLTVEVLQPVFGRAFDLNDIVLNLLGILVSATLFALGSAAARGTFPLK